jgi:phosphoserine phosphatase
MGDGANDLPMILASGIGIASMPSQSCVNKRLTNQHTHLALALDIIKEVKGDL